jgi:hypothetical protein
MMTTRQLTIIAKDATRVGISAANNGQVAADCASRRAASARRAESAVQQRAAVHLALMSSSAIVRAASAARARDERFRSRLLAR